MQISLKNKQGVCMVGIVILLLMANPTFSSDLKKLHTPKKTEITGYLFSELSEKEIKEKDEQYDRMIREAGWSAKKIKRSSSAYNGHGYAWHMSKGGTKVVIKSDDVPWYWKDGSYKQISKSEAAKGDIIVMTNPDDPTNFHSAVVSDKPQWCKSKWHDGPVFLHKFDEHPFGKTLTFYRKAVVATPLNLRIVAE